MKRYHHLAMIKNKRESKRERAERLDSQASMKAACSLCPSFNDLRATNLRMSETITIAQMRELAEKSISLFF